MRSVPLIAVIAVAAAVVAAVIWWHVNYRCVESHYEWRQDCTVHRDSHGRRTGETCHDRRVSVCDQWEPRE